jgi:hypothetical protein
MIVIESVELQGEQVTSDGYIFIKLLIGYQNAAVGCRYYASEDTKKAVILVGGIGGVGIAQQGGYILNFPRTFWLIESALYKFGTATPQTLMNV